MGDSVTDISGSLLADWLQIKTYCYDSVHFIYCNSSSVTESSCEKEVNEENNLPVENSDSAKFSLHLVRNQLEVTRSMKAENSGYEHKQLDSENVESSLKKNMRVKSRVVMKWRIGTPSEVKWYP